MRSDIGIHCYRQPDFIEPVDEAMLAERVDFEAEPVLERRGDDLVFKVDGHRVGGGDFHQPVDGGLRQHHQQQAVLERVARKNIGE